MALSFIFDSSKGETPETAARKRAIAAQIMGQIGNKSARNVGEGIGNAFASIGHGITANVMNRRADAAETKGREEANSLFDSITSAIQTGSPVTSGGGVPMPGAAGEVAATQPEGGMNYRDAIAGIESAGSGDYGAVGPTHSKLGRALGRYQIMEANIGPWSQAALGHAITPEQFMASPELQDKIFDHQFQQYVDKYGPEGAAQAWLGGEGGVGKTGRRDSLGTSIGEYGQRFMSSIGGAPAAIEAVSPTGNLSDEVADFRGTPEFMQAYPGGYTQQPLSDQQFDDRFGGDASAMPFADAGQQPISQQAIQQQSQQADPVQVAQATPQQDMLGGLSVQQLMQAASNPWLNESQRSIVNMLLQQKMQASDPMRQLEMDYKRAQIGKLRGAADGPAELGLNPQYGVDANGNPVLIQIGKDGKAVQTAMPDGVSLSKEPIKMDAGTHFVLLDPITRQPVGQIPKENRQEAKDKAIGAGEGKAHAETTSEYQSIKSKMPGLYGVVSRLGELAKKATYTKGGQLIDWTMAQAGAEPREGAVARAEYTAIVDNQILPLLRDTFGAQFTNEEGIRLARTLGDADKTPTEKAALLRAFIEQKERDIQALESRLGVSQEGQVNTGQVPQSGAVVDGYRFKGGDPADPSNWEKQ